MSTLRRLLTVENYLTSDGKYPDRAKSKELCIDYKLNAGRLVEAVNGLLKDLVFELPPINSGFRTTVANMAAGGSRLSSHCTCMAIDFHDPDHKLYDLCAANVPLLEKHGIYLEDKQYTKTWCHMTTRRPASGNRFFKP